MDLWLKMALVLVSGFAAASAWTMTIIAIEKRAALAAALLDGGIMVFGSVIPLTAWGATGNDWRLLVALTLGNMCGTYLTVGAKRRTRGEGQDSNS